MPLSVLLTLFLAHFGLGVVASLLLVSRAAGVKFFRFNGGLGTVMLIVALAFAARAGDGSLQAWPAVSLAALAVAACCTLAFVALAGRALARVQPWLLRGAVTAGAISIAGNAAALGGPSGAGLMALDVAGFATSAALLGTTSTAMILGHWYLVLPSMDVGHLMSMVRWMGGSLAARVLALVLAITLGPGTWGTAGIPIASYVWSMNGIFFWQRVLFGLVGPALLATLTWETAKIQSTQSATGILYVDLFAVVVGELLSKYLTIATGVPL